MCLHEKWGLKEVFLILDERGLRLKERSVKMAI
jgi:hypothetical protein